MNPDEFGAGRDFNIGEGFHGHRPGVVVVHRGEIVEAIGVADVLHIGEIFGDLFLAAVEVAEVRDGFEHHFAIGAQDQAEYAMG